MFQGFKTSENSNEQTNEPVFHEKGVMIDVTNFDATSPDDSLGYMCGGDIYVFRNGLIQIYADDKENDLLESLSVFNLVRASNQINNFDPKHTTEISMITESKDLRIIFQTKERKMDFWNALTATYDRLKEV